jgi:hypothetical protein
MRQDISSLIWHPKQMEKCRSETRQFLTAHWKKFIHLIQHSRLLPGHIPKITSLLWWKIGRKPMPFLFLLLYPQYRVENLAIAAAGPPARGTKIGKETLDASPIVVRERDL